jgi:DNA polymerase III subunit beta
MKATVNRSGFLQALAAVGPAVAARTTKPALTMVKLECSGDAMTVSGTDLEVGVRYDLPGVRVERPGVALVPPARLESILRKCQDADVNLTAEGTTLRVRTTTGRFEMAGADPAELPEVPPFDPAGPHWSMTAGAVRGLIGRTVFTVPAKEESGTWSLAGLNVELNGAGVTVAGTDTKIGAESVSDASAANGALSASGIVPVKAVRLILSALADDEERVRLTIERSGCVVRTERATVRSSLIVGRFPPYRQILPKKQAHALDVPVSEFVRSVEAAATLSGDELGKRVDLNFGPGRLTITASGADLGESEVGIDLPGYEGEDVSIGLDVKYVIGALKAAGDVPTVRMEMTNNGKPVIFTTGGDWKAFVMPRTN